MTTYDPAALRAAYAALPAGSWSLPSRFAENNVHHGNRRIVLVQASVRLPEAEPFGFVLDDFAPVHTAWLSWLEPGGFITPHRDAGPWRERWQIPIHAAGLLDEDGVRSQPRDGVPFRVQHHGPHSVWNADPRARIHLVLDRDVWLELPSEPFQTYPIPEEFADLVASVRQE